MKRSSVLAVFLGLFSAACAAERPVAPATPATVPQSEPVLLAEPAGPPEEFEMSFTAKDAAPAEAGELKTGVIPPSTPKTRRLVNLPQ